MRTIRLFLAQLLFTCCILGSLQSYACSSGPTFMSGCYYTDATGHQHFTLDITIACPTGSVYMWIHTASGGIIGPIATSGSTFVSSDGREGYDFINPSPVPTGSCYTIEFALTNN